MNTLHVYNVDLSSEPEQPQGQQGQYGSLSGFLLSAVHPSIVSLTYSRDQQTRPSREEVELLADGQCEV